MSPTLVTNEAIPKKIVDGVLRYHRHQQITINKGLWQKLNQLSTNHSIIAQYGCELFFKQQRIVHLQWMLLSFTVCK